MALRELTLDSIQHLDLGKAAIAFKRALERAVKDCLDRPSDDRVREVNLKFAIKPVKEIVDNVISCEGAKGTFQVKAKVPDYETDVYDFGVKENGMMYFSDESPKNHRQSMLFGGDEESEKS